MVQLIAGWSFEPEEEDEVAVADGEVVEGLERINEEWWKIRTRSGAEGIVPANILSEAADELSGHRSGHRSLSVVHRDLERLVVSAFESGVGRKKVASASKGGDAAAGLPDYDALSARFAAIRCRVTETVEAAEAAECKGKPPPPPAAAAAEAAMRALHAAAAASAAPTYMPTLLRYLDEATAAEAELRLTKTALSQEQADDLVKALYDAQCLHHQGRITIEQKERAKTLALSANQASLTSGRAPSRPRVAAAHVAAALVTAAHVTATRH